MTNDNRLHVRHKELSNVLENPSTLKEILFLPKFLQKAKQQSK